MSDPSDLTLPATVATELGVSAGDARLLRLIAAVSGAIASYLGRQLHYVAGMTELAQGFGRPRLLLNVSPIVSVTSVTLPDGSVVTDYIRENEAGMLYRRAGWPQTGLARAGLPPQSDLAPGTQEPAISVVYSAGWVCPSQGGTRTLPFDIEEAAIQAISTLYRRPGADQNIASESFGDYSVAYRGQVPTGGLLPDVVLPQLNRYSRPLG